MKRRFTNARIVCPATGIRHGELCVDDGVIVDGVDSDLELNLKTMARPALL